MDELIIEARLNEYTPREPNPHVPYSPEEIGEAAAQARDAGASIAHFHARDAAGGPSTDPAVYCRIGRALRGASDIICMPTLGAGVATEIDVRIGHVVEMGRDPQTRAELAPLDLVSSNTPFYDARARRFRQEDSVYVNTVAILRQLSEGIRKAGVRPMGVAWNVASLRLVEPLIETGVLQEPLYLQLTLTGGGILAGHPSTQRGLEALLDFVPEGIDLEWSVLSVGANLLDLAPLILERGGHFALGLGDYPHLELGTPTNAAVVARLVEIARAHGREPATPALVRERLQLPSEPVSSSA